MTARSGSSRQARWAERSLLHRGGTPGTWGSLGLWTRADDDYARACADLARTVGRAAGIQPGERVLSLACGAGDELLLWRDEFGAAECLGVEADSELQAAAQTLSGCTVLPGSPARLAALMQAQPGLLAAGRFDRVVCVDAAYHLRPRSDFLQAALRLLRPGGRLAFTDLVVAGRAPGFNKLMLSPSAWLAGVPLGELLDDAGSTARLQAAGGTDVQLQRLDDDVLGGFARFVGGHGLGLGVHNLSRAWRRPAITAGIIGPCRWFGLGYALLCASRPIT